MFNKKKNNIRIKRKNIPTHTHTQNIEQHKIYPRVINMKTANNN